MAVPQIAVDTVQLPTEAQQVLRFYQETDSTGTVVLPISFAAEAGDTAFLTVMETPSINTRLLNKIAGTLSDDKLSFSFVVSGGLLTIPGVFKGEVGVKRGSVFKLRIPVYVEIKMTLDSDQTDRCVEPLCIDDVRASMYDRGRNDNQTLDDVEFRDAEIAWAIIRQIETFNGMIVANVGGTFTTASFPYKSHWLVGAQGDLYYAAAQKLIRNRMPFQAGGVGVDINSRADEYLKIGMQLKKEFETWSLGVRRAANLQGWMGRIRNPLFGTMRSSV